MWIWTSDVHSRACIVSFCVLIVFVNLFLSKVLWNVWVWTSDVHSRAYIVSFSMLIVFVFFFLLFVYEVLWNV